MSKKYITGQEPMVGDIVKVSPKNNFSWESQLRSERNNNYRSRFEVIEILTGVKSTLIRVKQVNPFGNYRYDHLNNPMKASHFELVTGTEPKDSDGTPKPPHKYMVVQRNKLNSFFMARTEEELNTKLGKALLENPTREYIVYEYGKTAKTKEPVVEFIFDQ